LGCKHAFYNLLGASALDVAKHHEIAMFLLYIKEPALTRNCCYAFGG